MKDLNEMAGRQCLISQEDSSIFPAANKIPAIENNHCNRCGQLVTGILPNQKKYCRICLGIGRICEGDYLVRQASSEEYPRHRNGGLSWQGELTLAQGNISNKLIENFNKHLHTLVHAVTGAGKTEMLFDLIAECLKKGQRAAIATPRIDVVNELYPRFKVAFSKVEIGKYHGREYFEAKNEQLIICTTHQLLKYYQAFDLLVIDEVDSFPYVDNPALHFAASNAVKKMGSRVYLTATPTEDLLVEAKAGKLEILKLNRRFHGGLLPVPKEQLFLRPFIIKNKLNPKLKKAIAAAIKSGHPLLIFIPRIAEIDLYLNLLRKMPELKEIKMAGVHAADPKRLEKVQQFREGKLQLMVTTTILERGVTFKRVWVIIVAADDAIYTTASLVQIAGRVGRDKDDRSGMILYCYHKYTSNIYQAVRQIKEMNQ